MGRKVKAGIIFLVILLILSLTGAATGFYFFQQEKYKVDALRKELENVKAEREYIEKKLAESRSEVKELNVRLEATQRRIDELNSELKRAESENTELTSQIETLQSKLQQQKKISEEWRVKQTQAQKEIDNLQTLLNSLQENKEKLEAQIAQLEAKKEVALGKIVVGEERPAEEQPASSAQAAASQVVPTLEGKVLVINRDYDFAVINLGRQQGIGEGDVFSVYHNNNYIGDIQVERVQETMSAFGFTTPDIEDNISEGIDLALGKIASGEEKPVKEQAAPSAQLAAPQAVSTLEGQVLVINRDYNFAVINLGLQDGISEADVFSVYHEDDYIGDIQVDKIQKNMGSCVFLTEEVKNKIREGDRVIRK